MLVKITNCLHLYWSFCAVRFKILFMANFLTVNRFWSKLAWSDPTKNVNFSNIFRPISTTFGHSMSHWCRIRYIKFCVDICNGFGVILKKKQEGADSAPPQWCAGPIKSHRSFFWGNQRIFDIWLLSCSQQSSTLGAGGQTDLVLPPVDRTANCGCLDSSTRVTDRSSYS